MNQRVLVIRIGRLGDTILATPIIQPLRHACGTHVLIDFAVSPGAGTAILKLDQRINQVFPVAHRAVPWYLNPSKQALRKHSRNNPYDLVFNLECGAACDDFIEFVSARDFFGRPLCGPRHLHGRHCVDTEKTVYADVLGPEAVAAAVPSLQLAPCEEDSLSSPGGNFVILNPGFFDVQKRGYRSHRGWPHDHWIRLIDLIRRCGYAIAINGSAGEKSYFESLLQRPGVKSLFGTTLKELIAAMRRARCVISVDTGSMHLASALGVPTIALFGPTDAGLTGPYPGIAGSRILSSGVECRPCVRTPLQKKCGFNRCMQELNPLAVFEAFENMMQHSGDTSSAARADSSDNI